MYRFAEHNKKGESSYIIISEYLDCRWLHDRRQAAIEGEIYDENYNLLPDDELQQRLETIMNKDANGKYTEFCFVIKNVIEGLLEGKHSN